MRLSDPASIIAILQTTAAETYCLVRVAYSALRACRMRYPLSMVIAVVSGDSAPLWFLQSHQQRASCPNA